MYDNGIAVHGELYLLRLWVVKHFRVFQRLNTSRLRRTNLGVTLADVYLHRYLLQVVLRIEDFPYDDNGLHAEVDKEGDGRKCQDGHQAGSAYQSLYLLANAQSVVAARIVAGIIKERRQQFGHGYRCPYHGNSQTHKPFQQVYLVGMHQVDRHQQDIGRYYECRQSEAALDEKPRSIGSYRSASILELTVLVHNLAFAWCLNHALVGTSRSEKRDESPCQID